MEIEAEQRHRHVNLADVDESSDTELIVFETFAVRPIRALVFRAGEKGDVAIMEFLLRDRFEVEHGERFARRRDQVGGVRRLPELLLGEC